MTQHLVAPSVPPTVPLQDPLTAGASRELTRREREVLALLIDRGEPFDAEQRVVEEADRARWRAQLTTVRAGRSCGCGTCPSIELTRTNALRAAGDDGYPVVEGSTLEAMLLLFVDDEDQLSYLELAPTGERTFSELPDPSDIHTT